MLFSLDATLVVFVISFLIFMVLLNEVMLKPVGRTLDQRAKYIEDQIAEGKQAHREAEALQTDYDNNLKRIREEAQHVIAKAVDEANKARGEQLGKIAAEGQQKLEKAKKEIEAEREKLIDALVAEERELVETIARKVLGDESVNVSIDAGQVRRTLEEAR
jgi:F-type H+-transporting ATPase subunit b